MGLRLLYSGVKVTGYNDVAQDVEGSLLHRVAELDEPSLVARVVHEKNNLGPPELDMLPAPTYVSVLA